MFAITFFLVRRFNPLDWFEIYIAYSLRKYKIALLVYTY